MWMRRYCFPYLHHFIGDQTAFFSIEALQPGILYIGLQSQSDCNWIVLLTNLKS